MNSLHELSLKIETVLTKKELKKAILSAMDKADSIEELLILKWHFNKSLKKTFCTIKKEIFYKNVERIAYQNALNNNQAIIEDLKNGKAIEKIEDNYNTTASAIKRILINCLENGEDDVLELVPKVVNINILPEQDRDFLRSDYFRARKKKIINTYVLNMKSGKVLQNADNLVIVGSPYAMLLRAVGKDPETDETFQMEDGAIQCFTNRFKFGDYLACFRNPFNGRENLGILHNVHHPYFDKYFDFGELIIAVNLVHTDFQNRNNGLTYWAGSRETLFKK